MLADFALASLLFAAVPGPGATYTIGCAIEGGVLPHLCLAATGLSGVIQARSAFELARWMGAAYLAYVGLSMICRSGPVPLMTDAAPHPRTRVTRRAVLMSTANPKLTAFFIALLPLAVFSLYACVRARARAWAIRAPRLSRWTKRSLGAVVVAFAIRLATG